METCLEPSKHVNELLCIPFFCHHEPQRRATTDAELLGGDAWRLRAWVFKKRFGEQGHVIILTGC